MRALGILCLIWFSRSAFACSTCIGNPDSAQSHAMNMSIIFMLGVVAAMLTLFAAFFVHLRIRAKKLADETPKSRYAAPFVEVNVHE